MSGEEVPPWLREHLVRFEQAQQSFQAVLVQKQQVEMELTEVEKALSELSKAAADTPVYKSAGSLLIKTGKDAMLKELEERRELGNTRVTVLAKQENRLRESLKEIRAKIEEATRGRTQPKSN
ncbi:MAG: prefoldin subunit beta [Nitrososphaerales archaeon]